MPITTIRGGRQINDGTIPYADIQQVVANAILGNNTGSLATVTEIQLSTNTLLGRGANDIVALSLGTGLTIGGSQLQLTANLQSLSSLAYGSLSFVKMSAAGTFSLDTNTYTTGSGAANQIAYWSGTTALTGSATFTFSPTAQLLLNNSVTASSAVARGVNFTPTLIAAANNDTLIGLDIAPTYTNGAFTGLTNVDLRTRNAGVVIGTSYAYGTNYGFSNDGIVQIKDVGSSGILAGNQTTQIVLRPAGAAASYNSNWWGYIEMNSSGMLVNSGRYLGGLYLRAGGSGSAASIYFQNSASNTAAMIAAATGNFLIGTTTDSGGYRLNVSGTAVISSILTIGSPVTNTGHIQMPSTGGSLLITPNNYNPVSQPNNNVLITNAGSYTSLTSSAVGNVMIGSNVGITLTTGNSNILFGRGMGNGLTTGTGNVLFGYTDASNLPNLFDSLHLVNRYFGNDASLIPTSRHVFIGGGYDTSRPLQTYYFGLLPFTPNSGISSINFNAPSGSGADVSGASFTINAGRGTGTGVPGDIIFGTSTGLGTGSTLQSLTNRVWIKGSTGRVGIATSTPSYLLEVNGSCGVASLVAGQTLIVGTLNNFNDSDYLQSNTRVYSPSTVRNNLNSYGFMNSIIYDLQSASYTGSSAYNAAALFNQVTIGGNATTKVTQPIRAVQSLLMGQTLGTAMNISSFRYFEVNQPNAAGLTGHNVDNCFGLYIQQMKGTTNYTITNGWGVYQEGSQDNNYFNGKVLIGTATSGGSPVRIINLPTSSTGLSAGDLWNDGGTIKIVNV